MSRLDGKITDMGHIVIVEQWLIKGQPSSMVWHFGAPRVVPLAERPDPVPTTTRFHPERTDVIMDVQADKAIPLLPPTLTDEPGNPVPTPAGTVVTYSVDNTAVIALTDNGDGSGLAATTGLLGNAVLHMDIALPSGVVITGDLLLSVVPGDAERAEFNLGAPVEVTPDV